MNEHCQQPYCHVRFDGALFELVYSTLEVFFNIIRQFLKASSDNKGEVFISYSELRKFPLSGTATISSSSLKIGWVREQCGMNINNFRRNKKSSMRTDNDCTYLNVETGL